MPSSQALAAFALKQAKKHGEDRTDNSKPAVIVPTGSIAIDWALRVGGLQRGRLYEFLGPKDAGKTTCGISCMIQHRLAFPDYGVGYVNLEKTFSEERATAMGLECSKEHVKAGLWHPRKAHSAEEASDMARDLASSGMVSIVVIDSIGAMESDRVLEKEAEKAADNVGRTAKIITQMSKALAKYADDHDCTIILVNQPRANIGGMGADVSAGPKAMQHATTAKLEFRPKMGAEDLRTLDLGDPDPTRVSHKVVVKCTRMKNGIEGRVVEPYVNRIATRPYGPPGWDDADSYLTIGARQKIITIGGAYYTFPDGAKINGRIAAATYLRKNPDACRAVRAQITFDTPIDPMDGDE